MTLSLACSMCYCFSADMAKVVANFVEVELIGLDDAVERNNAEWSIWGVAAW